MDPKRCEKGAQNHREAIRNEAKKGAKPTDAAQRREKTKRYAERLQRDAARGRKQRKDDAEIDAEPNE